MRRILALLAALVMAMPVASQQIVNPDADVSVARPAWSRDTGPRVAIDAAHDNFHTLDGRYAPFAALLRNDGYRVSSNGAPFTAESLADIDILVIANAGAGDGRVDGGRSAFTDAEIAAVRRWVEGGGALLLIADHAPFAGAAAALGRALGVAFRNGYAMDPGAERASDIFRAGAGLAQHPVTRGAGGDPAITQVRSFTGSAFEAPAGQPLLVLNERYVMVYPARPFQPGPNDRREPVPGLLQGATLEIGRGRVVVMGEAAMFSSQMIMPQRFLMGFGAPGAEQNQRFALNLMHWLSRRPGY